MKNSLLILILIILASCSGDNKISLDCVIDNSNDDIHVLFEIRSGSYKKTCLVTQMYNEITDGSTQQTNLNETEFFFQCELPETDKSYKKIYKINRTTGNLIIELSSGAVLKGRCKKLDDRKF